MSEPTDDEGSRSAPAGWRVTRNWKELLQELRVAQTGVQILTAFLLTVPFSARFDQLTGTQRDVYLGVLAGSVTATALLVTPVAMHRALFHHRQRAWLVEEANRFAVLGLTVLALTMAGAMWLVFDVTLGGPSAWIALGCALVLFVGLWLAWPLSRRATHP